MGVALGASEGDSLEAGPKGVHAVQHGGDAVFLVVGSTFRVRRGEALHRGGDFVVDGAVGQQIPGELLQGELVVGQVVVAGADQPVAVGPDVAAGILFVALGLRVAGEIHPEDRPAFAEGGRSEQPVDDVFVGITPPTLGEGGRLLECRRETGQVERHAAEPLEAVRVFRGLQLLRVEPRQNEAVQWLAAPAGARHFGQGLRFRWDVGPVFGPRRSLLYPFTQPLDVLFRQGRPVLRRWHPVLLVRSADTIDDLRLLRIARDDGDLAGLARLQGAFPDDERNVAGPLHAAVTHHAVLVEEGTNLGGEIDRVFRGGQERRTRPDQGRERQGYCETATPD
jgi:hypothetical protein